MMDNNIEQPLHLRQQTDQLRSVSSTYSSHSPSKTFIILMVAFLTITVGLGGYILGANQNQIVQNQPQLVPPIIQPSPIPTIDPTAAWKTYANTKYGYSIKYPQDWILKECPSAPDCGRTDETTYINSSEYIGSGPEPLNYYIYISKYNFEPPPKFKYKREVVNNLPALRTIDFPSREGAETVLFKRNENDYISLGFTPYDAQNKFQDQDRFYKTFDQILSTFRFTP